MKLRQSSITLINPLVLLFSSLILLFSCHPRPTSSNSAKTKFTTTDFSEAFALAESKGLPIFIDFYTSWCGPCKQMDRDVFTQPKVATMLNESFIALKVNAERGEGIQLAREFNIRGYPSLLFLNTQGELIDRLEGYTSAPTLLTYARKAITKNKKVLTSSDSTSMPKNIDQKRLRDVLMSYIFSTHIGTLETYSLDKIESAEWINESEESIKVTYRVKVDTNAKKIGEETEYFYREFFRHLEVQIL